MSDYLIDESATEPPHYTEEDFCTQVITPDNVGYMLTGTLDHAAAVKQLRAELTKQIAEAQAVLAFTDDQLTITHHEVW